MAPRKPKRKKPKRKRVLQLLEPKQADVAAAVVHLGRLAASHSGWGVAFTTGGTDPDYLTDKASRATLAKVVGTLLADRKRMAARNADLLKHRLHEVITRTFSEARNRAEIEENIEEVVDQRMRGLGFALGPSQMTRFAVDAQHIKDRTASQAAANALLDGTKGHATPKTKGRSIFDAKDRQATRPPIPAPMNRYVPLRTLRHYFRQAIEAVEAQRMLDVPLSIEALESDAYVEALQHRVEALFKKRISAELVQGEEEFAKFFLALFRGEAPPTELVVKPEVEQQLTNAREQFRAFAAALLSLADGDPAVLDQKAHEGARWFIAMLKNALDTDDIDFDAECVTSAALVLGRSER